LLVPELQTRRQRWTTNPTTESLGTRLAAYCGMLLSDKSKAG
jgi:hypothetical protein